MKLDHITNHVPAHKSNWLLPLLRNGQVKVGDVEEELGMVAEEKEKYKRRK